MYFEGMYIIRILSLLQGSNSHSSFFKKDAIDIIISMTKSNTKRIYHAYYISWRCQGSHRIDAYGHNGKRSHIIGLWYVSRKKKGG
jgi:hypothetical protein